MKKINYESKQRRMRQYHRNCSWRLGAGGLYIPYDYSQGRVLSWWDDVGFILNGRRVMVWWVHPRMKYADAIEKAGWDEAGELPDSSRHSLDDDKCVKQFKRLGRSRKKVVAYRSLPVSSEVREFYDRLGEIQTRIADDGIDLVVFPSMSIQSLDWCTGVELCLPVEILNEHDAATLASIVRHVLKNGRSLAALASFVPSDYQYGREQWLAEASLRKGDREARTPL